MSLSHFLLILKARWGVVLSVFLFAVCIAAGVSMILPSQYTASATIVIDVKSPDTILGTYSPGISSSSYMATQVEIMESERVARKVVRMLGIDRNAQALAQWRTASGGKGQIDEYYGKVLGKKLVVQPAKEGNVVTLSFTGTDPAFAAAVTNAFAQSYIETTVDLRVDPAKLSAKWFDERTKQLRDDLEKAQSRLSAYQQETGIIATDERLDIENTRLADLSTQLTTVQALRVDASAKDKQAKINPTSTAELLLSPVAQTLRAEIAKAEAKLELSATLLGRNHPELIRQQNELAELKRQLTLESSRVSNSLSSTTASNSSRVAELQAALDAQKEKVLDIKKKRNELSVLQKEVESAQKSFDLVSQRLSQTSLESQTQQTNVAILTPAVEPTERSSPRLKFNLVIASVAGLLLGIGLALLLEMLKRRVRSPEDLALTVGVPVLAVLKSDGKIGKKIPNFRFGKRFGKSR